MERPEEWLGRAGIRYKAVGPELITDCPACGKPKHVYVNRKTGLWNCKRCNASGNALSLQKALGLVLELGDEREGRALSRSIASHEEQALADGFARFLSRSPVQEWADALQTDPRAEAARRYLTETRGITLATAQTHLIGWCPGKPPAAEDKRPDLPSAATAPQRPSSRPLPARLLARLGAPHAAPVAADERAHGAPVEPGWITIPIFAEYVDGLPVPASLRLVKKRHAGEPKGFQRVAGGESALYAPGGLNPDGPLLLVGGELDALSCVQAGMTNVAASTLGESAWNGSWSEQLEAFADVTIAYDDDDAGKLGASKVAADLGVHRCKIAPPWGQVCAGAVGAKDANEAMVKAGIEAFDVFAIEAWIRKAKPCGTEGVTRFGAMRKRYLEQYDPQKLKGDPTPWADLTKLIGGCRGGEVTVWTGTEGSGKSTMVSDWMLHDAKRGIGGLIIPLELGPMRQTTKLLHQFMGVPPSEVDKKEIESAFDKAEGLPLWILEHYGSMEVEPLRNTIRLAARRYGIRRVALDHLHFAVEDDENRRQKIGAMMRMLTETAMRDDLHIHVVAHPKAVPGKQGNENRDDVMIQSNDLKGDSAIKQDADNIIAVYRPRKANREAGKKMAPGTHQAMVTVLKCRSDDGTEGRVPLLFHERSATYSDDDLSFEVPAEPATEKRLATRGTWHDEL